MAKKSRKDTREIEFDPYDDFDDVYDDDIDLKSLSRDFFSTEWNEPSQRTSHGSARRKIERRNEMRKLYSELNDWEEFGQNENWHAY
jgi:hypothetical protein